MNFFHQYKDLFQVGNYPSIPSNRLKLDNQLFIDRPYIPTYTQQHSLNSKLRELKKDYNEFESRVKELEELEDIPQRSQSRRKQYAQETNTNNNLKANRSPKEMQSSNSPNNLNQKKNRSTIFDHYQQNKSQYMQQKNIHPRQQRSLSNNSLSNGASNQPTFARNKLSLRPSQSPFALYQENRGNEMNQKENQLQGNLKNSSGVRQQQLMKQQYQQQLSQQSFQEKRLLESLRRQNEQNTQKLIRNQNSLKNKFYQQDTNNVLQQSQINHIFNWKLQKPSTFDKLDYLPQSTIPKYKVQPSNIQVRQTQVPPVNNQRNFTIRNVLSNNEIKPNARNKIVPQQKQHNVPNKNSSAQERRRIAKMNIDDRREKLKMVLKAFF